MEFVLLSQIVYAKISSYTQLLVWQAAIELVMELYQLTKEFPDAEKYGLTSQVRRASVSVPANIAEGWGRGSTGNYIQFLNLQGIINRAGNINTHCQ